MLSLKTNEPSVSIERPDGYSTPILFNLLNTCIMNMTTTLNDATLVSNSYISAIKFLNYSKIAINTIPAHKVFDPVLLNSVKKEWNSLFEHLYKLNQAPPHQRVLTLDDIIRMHNLFGDIIRCIDAAGLGWGNYFTIATKTDLIRNYMEKGRT